MTPTELMKFVGRTNPYAIQTNDGGYIPVYKDLDETVIARHLAGEITVGSYVINEQGKVNWAVIDIDGDANNLEPYNGLADFVFTLFPEFERVKEFSGRRGYHVWLLLPEPEHPAFMRELIKTRFREHGLKNIEIYPKQDRVEKLGNLVKLPCGKHKKGGWSRIEKWETA